MDRCLFIRVVLIVLAVAVYWQVTGFGFVDFDDPEYVRNNAIVLNGLTAEGIHWAFTTGHAANWHPLTWLSLMLDTEMYSRNVRGYHITNLALHALNALLVFTLLQSMTGAIWRSAFVAALLAVHPIHVESVAWIAERKDVLSMTFWLLTSMMYVSYVRHGGVHRYIATAGLLTLGLMAKPMLVTLPIVFLLLDYWPLRRILRHNAVMSATPHGRSSTGNSKLTRVALEKLPLLLIVAAVSSITMIVQRGSHQLDYGIWVALPERIANAVVSYVRYLGHLFWPVDLAVLYPNPYIIGQPFWSAGHVIGAAGILLAITGIAVLLRRTHPYVIVGWLWFLGTMVPVIGIVQIGPQSMADRYAYITFIGLYIIIAWGANDLAARFKRRDFMLGALAGLALACCCVLTVRQVRHWENGFTLFDHTLAVTTDNWLIHSNLGVILAQANRIDEAIHHNNEALQIYNDCGWLHEHLGTVYSVNDLPKAQASFERAIQLDPTLVKAHSNLGVVLTQQGRPLEGLIYIQKAAELAPDDADAHRALALALSGVGRNAEALVAIERAMHLKPDDASYGEVKRVIQSQLNSTAPPGQP